jgi:putative redox protein
MKNEIDISCKLISGMAFEAESDGHILTMDSSSDTGGNDLGPRPKPLLLMSLAGCTAMDVIAILKKMRYEPRHLEIKAKAKTTDEHPRKIVSIQLTYEVSSDVPLENLQKAVNMSQDKYCGVYATLAPSVKITNVIKIME